MELVVQPDGTIRCLYGEEIALEALGRLDIHRASRVEPTSEGLWTADLTPFGGPLLGPFGRRSDALAAERRWLLVHWLGSDAGP